MQPGARWLAVWAALCACEGRPAPAVDATVPAAEVVPPAATQRPVIDEAQVVGSPGAAAPADTAATPVVPDAVTPVVPDAGPGSPALAAPAAVERVMYPVLRHRGRIEVASAAPLDFHASVSSYLWRLFDDDILVTYDERRFVVFTTGTGAAAEPPELHDLPVDGRESYLLLDETGEFHEGDGPDEEITLGWIDGRWPEALFVTTTRSHTRTFDRPEVSRWSDGWLGEDNTVDVYEDFEVQWDQINTLTWVDGGVLALRDLQCGSEQVSCDGGVIEAYGDKSYAQAGAALKRAFRAFKPLVVAHGPATPLPRLPKHGDIVNMHTTIHGDIFVVGPGPAEIQRWSLARKKWRTLPLPDGASPRLFGDDPAHLYAVGCTEHVASLARLVGETFVADALPSRACGWDLEIERTGALWALYEEPYDSSKPRGTAAANELWHRPVGGAWERVSLAPLQLAADANGRWISDGLSWRLDPAPGLVHLIPQRVAAIGPGDVFIAAEVVETGDTLILRDRPLPATMIDVAPTQIATYIYEVGNDRECVPQHLVLATFDRDVALAEAWPQLLAELKGTPGLRLYEVPGVGENWRLIAMIDGRPHAPEGKRAALTALRERLLKLAPDLPQPQCGLPATPRREHAIGAPPIEPPTPETVDEP